MPGTAGAPTQPARAPVASPVDATKIALEIQATNAAPGTTQVVDATKIALEIQATNNAPKTAQPVDATKVALEVQATDAAAQLTQQANQPTAQPPAQPPAQPSAGTPNPSAAEPDYSELIQNAKILVYEDVINIDNRVRDALDLMHLKYTHVGDARGNFLGAINSGTRWDLIIADSEDHRGIQGEFWDTIRERVTGPDKTALIAELWYLDETYNGRIKPLMNECGIAYQKDWLMVESVFILDSTHPVFTTPHSGFSLIHYSPYWPFDPGDLIKILPGSDATLLAGTFQKRKSDYGVMATCFEGRVVFQTFCDHDFRESDTHLLWQNYITWTLTNHFKALKK
jgi:hypothetical protein